MVIYNGDDMFNAMVVSLGLLGVVLQITESAFSLKEVTVMTTLKQLVDQCNSFTEPYEYTNYNRLDF